VTAAFGRLFARVENVVASVALLAMVLLPLVEIVARRLGTGGVPGSIAIVQHLTLWVAFLGAAMAARDGKLLALATATFLPEGRVSRTAAALAAAVAVAVTALLAWGAIDLVRESRAFEETIGPDIPKWLAQIVLPVSLVVITVRLVLGAGRSWIGRAVAAVGLIVAALVWQSPEILLDRSVLPWLFVIIGAGLLGAPIFALLGGAGVALNLGFGDGPIFMLISTYDLSVKPTLPAIPLFTLAGFLLAEGRSSERLLRVFRAWFGWMPGGTAIVCAFVCSFFTVFTGGSGVTFLALGGLLLPALVKDGYRERFSLGLLTASGSLGLLLPPALPLILYAVVAEQPIDDMFLGGLLPGVLLTTLVALWGVREGMRNPAPRPTFTWREAVAAAWAGKWELAVPVIVLGAMFVVGSTPVEASAVTALYALIVQTVVHRDLSIGEPLIRVLVECLTIVGGVLLILSVAVGLTDYMIIAQVPTRLLEWTQTYVNSRIMFLLILNVFLLVVGAFVDIFSATVVIVPLIAAIGRYYEIHPVHLGIIFIANLELGYLTPPVGLNLFLSSYRFKKPVLEVARATLPMLGIMGIGVLLITYVPWLTLGLLELFGRVTP